MPRTSKPQPGPLTHTVADIIRSQLARLDRTQTQLADVTTISQSQISKILRGEGHIDLDQLDQMCEALGLDMIKVVEEAYETTVVHSSQDLHANLTAMPRRSTLQKRTRDTTAAAAEIRDRLDEIQPPTDQAVSTERPNAS